MSNVELGRSVEAGTVAARPSAGQLAALRALERTVGAPIEVRYNPQTGTPNHLLSYEGPLSPARSTSAERVAREFLTRWRAIFRFSASDLDNLRLKSRAHVRDVGVTILDFEQRAAGLPVYHGKVLVNVDSDGRVLSVGSDSYPALIVKGAFARTAAEVVRAVARSVGVDDARVRFTGIKRVLRTYGDLPPVYDRLPSYHIGGAAQRTTVSRVAFPDRRTARRAYVFTLTPRGQAWQFVVDAESGKILRRLSLVVSYGPRGGGRGLGRRATFRPDIQDRVEGLNRRGTAIGKVFDGSPTVLSGRYGYGRAAKPGFSPGYAQESTTEDDRGRGFRFSFVEPRTASALVFDLPFSQVARGLPDARNPTRASPYGWFYLPTEHGGTEAYSTPPNYAATRAFGYEMDDEARQRNPRANGPDVRGLQPFSADRTRLARTRKTADDRVLPTVFESRYTEGNNVVAVEDRAGDSEEKQGIRGYARDRRFAQRRFEFRNGYEFGNTDAGGDPFYPSSADAQVLSGTVSLFYYTNLMHDYLYDLGFTESLWNFQQDNFGKGGAGGDALRAFVQKRGTNNATFFSSPDGSPPAMSMFLFTDDVFRRADSSFDFDVVAHEFFHGVSTRSTGKGGEGCAGNGLVGEQGGEGEGWSDYIAASMSDDDALAEYSTGQFDVGIRKMPMTNYRWSYGSMNQLARTRRDGGVPDPLHYASVGDLIPFEAHGAGEIFGPILWDMRELLVVRKGAPFFDGSRRLGKGTRYFVAGRGVRSVDDRHPIDYRASFNTQDPTTIAGRRHIVRPRLVAAEIVRRRNRNGPLATGLASGAALADKLVLRGLQLGPCNPSFVQTRDSILLADRMLTAGENQAIIWRAFASHGVGANAASTGSTDGFVGIVPIVREDFSVPEGVAECERFGPLRPPSFSVANFAPNAVRVRINGGKPVDGAVSYVVSRASGRGRYHEIARLDASQTTYLDGSRARTLRLGASYRYRVHAARSPECVSGAQTRSVTIRAGR